MKICKNCQKTYADDQNFCYFCGAPTEFVDGDVKVCECGHCNSSDAKFCTACGESFIKEKLPPVETASTVKILIAFVAVFLMLASICTII